MFCLNPKLDADRLAREYARTRRLHIPELLEGEGAERLYRHLKDRDDWRLVINDGEKLFELDRAAQGSLTPEASEKLELAVYRSARAGFQFRFETIRVPDSAHQRAEDATLLSEFARFLSSPPTLDFLKRITHCPAISVADAQATAYGPGHFLTGHDDDVGGKNRLAAYVVNLTPAWRPEWGGLLMFHGAEGGIEDALVPRFNALNIFQVPQLHSVSYVAPYVPRRRYAVTGWLRSGEPG